MTEKPVLATLGGYAKLSRTNGHYFLEESRLLIPPHVSDPSSTVQTYLSRLSRSAQAAAESAACGSLLAGQGSESDDFGDVAVWLGSGDFGRGKEGEVLSVLDLAGTAEEVQPIDLIPGRLVPCTIDERSITSSFDTVQKDLESLSQVYCFAFRPNDRRTTGVFVLLGYLKDVKTPGWVGLFGMGTYSD